MGGVGGFGSGVTGGGDGGSGGGDGGGGEGGGNEGGIEGGGGDGGGEWTTHEPSSVLAALSKLWADTDMQPSMVYRQQPSHAAFASAAKFLAVLSMQPTTCEREEKREARGGRRFGQ